MILLFMDPEPSQPTASTCPRCGRIFVQGTQVMCSACRKAARRASRSRSYIRRKHRLTCECGQPAVTVLLVRLGKDDSLSTVRMPLCQHCLDLEKEMWAS